MQKKKVLHFISGLEVGGAETQLLRILPKLQQYHDNRVCCVRGRGPIGKDLGKRGIRVYYLDLKSIFDIFAILRLRKAIRDFSPDIMVTYLIHADLYGRVLGKLFGVKKIVCSKRGALLQWEWLAKLDWLTRKFVSHYLVQTETAKKEWMKRVNLPENKFTVIPNGIDANFFAGIEKDEKLRQELGIDRAETVIICVANLHVNKGHKFLLEAFEKVFRRDKQIKLLLVGDGEEKENLKKQIENYKAKNNILFLGKRTDVPELLKISDIFVLPTMFEGMSNAILEAMACGLPIITTDIPENRELIKDKINGILVPVNNTNEIATSLNTLLNDKNLIEKLAKNAQMTVTERFDIEKVTRDIASFLASL